MALLRIKNPEPLFVVTGTINEKLISAMRGRILPEVRRLVGPKRRVTMVFGREGWSPEPWIVLECT